MERRDKKNVRRLLNFLPDFANFSATSSHWELLLVKLQKCVTFDLNEKIIFLFWFYFNQIVSKMKLRARILVWPSRSSNVHLDSWQRHLKVPWHLNFLHREGFMFVDITLMTLDSCCAREKFAGLFSVYRPSIRCHRWCRCRRRCRRFSMEYLGITIAYPAVRRLPSSCLILFSLAKTYFRSVRLQIIVTAVSVSILNNSLLICGPETTSACLVKAANNAKLFFSYQRYRSKEVQTVVMTGYW